MADFTDDWQDLVQALGRNGLFLVTENRKTWMKGSKLGRKATDGPARRCRSIFPPFHRINQAVGGPSGNLGTRLRRMTRIATPAMTRQVEMISAWVG